MKKLSFVCAAAFLLIPFAVSAAEFHDKGGVIAVDFPEGWVQGKSDDPLVTLKAEKGKSHIEFTRQDSELSDYYLKARVKENVETLRNKGAEITGEIKPVSLHGVSNAYTASYEMMGSHSMAFLTYNGASYFVSANGMAESDFRAALGSVRKPGEKIELPKKPKIVRKKKVKEEPEDEPETVKIEDSPVASSTAAAAETSASTETASEPGVVVDAGPSAAQAMADSAGKAAQDLLGELAKKSMDKSSAPYYQRKPLPFSFWGGLLAFWFFGSFLAKASARSYQNPKLPPPPADIPPDFFFPFMIQRGSSMKETVYSVVTRQKQRLQGEYPHEHEPYLVFAVYGCAFLHAVWSLLAAFGRGGIVPAVMLKLPFGRFFASMPEIFFLLPLAYGLFLYFTRKRVLEIYDAQSNLVMQAKPEIAYCLIRDGQGQEVARLNEKTGEGARKWNFVDTDNLVVFTLVDDCPRMRLLRRLFGSLGGALRARYGIFVADRRAGFVYVDPSSPDRFQIHLDFAFARLAQPAQMLAAVLYLLSREKDHGYPSPF